MIPHPHRYHIGSTSTLVDSIAGGRKVRRLPRRLRVFAKGAIYHVYVRATWRPRDAGAFHQESLALWERLKEAEIGSFRSKKV
jgi:hypothetical protein